MSGSPHDRGRGFLQRTSLADARAILLRGIGRAGEETVRVDDAFGRTAAATVTARHDSPHYRASAMDGIAVRAADTAAAPVELAAIAAGEAATAACCQPVDTGSLLPEWADAVVRIEDTEEVGGAFRVRRPVAPGRDVRRAGEDIASGAVVLREGEKVRPYDIAALLATGTTEIRVARRPSLAIVATGSEVIEAGEGPLPGRVIESNSRLIAALAEQWGAGAHRLGIVADDRRLLGAALVDAASRFDAVCVIAGSSAGRKDLTVETLRELGHVSVHGIDIAPGRPAALGRIEAASRRDPTPVIVVPGYPVAAVVVCEQLLRPLLLRLAGAVDLAPARTRAVLRRSLPSRLGVEEFRRVCLALRPAGELVAATLAAGAGAISTVTGAHGWLRIGSTVEGLDAGAQVDVELLVEAERLAHCLVLGGAPSPAVARLERLLRREDPLFTIACLGRAAHDAVEAARCGEAHGALVAAGEGGDETLEIVCREAEPHLRLVLRRDAPRLAAAIARALAGGAENPKKP